MNTRGREKSRHWVKNEKSGGLSSNLQIIECVYGGSAWLSQNIGLDLGILCQSANKRYYDHVRPSYENRWDILYNLDHRSRQDSIIESMCYKGTAEQAQKNIQKGPISVSFSLVREKVSIIRYLSNNRCIVCFWVPTGIPRWCKELDEWRDMSFYFPK